MIFQSLFFVDGNKDVPLDPNTKQKCLVEPFVMNGQLWTPLMLETGEVKWQHPDSGLHLGFCSGGGGGGGGGGKIAVSAYQDPLQIAMQSVKGLNQWKQQQQLRTLNVWICNSLVEVVVTYF